MARNRCHERGISVAKVVAWNVALLLVAALMIEAIFGSWFRAPNLWSLSIFRNKDWTYHASGKYAGKALINYRRDYYALRGNYGEPSDVDIVTLGGSTTDERFIDEGRTWPDVLDACLEQAGFVVGTANAGVSGQTTRGHAANFDIWLNHIPGLAPRYAIAYFGVNEKAVEVRADKDDVRDYNESDRPISRLKIFRKWVYMNSAIYAGWRIIRGNLVASTLDLAPYRRKDFDRRVFRVAEFDGETGAETVNRQYAENSSKTMDMSSSEFQRRVASQRQGNATKLNALKDRLEILRKKIIEFGAVPIFVTQSWGTYRISDGVVSGKLSYYFRTRAENETVMEFCREKGVFCINLGEELEFADGDFYDGVHTTPQGSTRVGEFICSRLLAWEEFSLDRK